MHLMSEKNQRTLPRWLSEVIGLLTKVHVMTRNALIAILCLLYAKGGFLTNAFARFTKKVNKYIFQHPFYY